MYLSKKQGEKESKESTLGSQYDVERVVHISLLLVKSCRGDSVGTQFVGSKVGSHNVIYQRDVGGIMEELIKRCIVGLTHRILYVV